MRWIKKGLCVEVKSFRADGKGSRRIKNKYQGTETKPGIVVSSITLGTDNAGFYSTSSIFTTKSVSALNWQLSILIIKVWEECWEKCLTPLLPNQLNRVKMPRPCSSSPRPHLVLASSTRLPRLVLPILNLLLLSLQQLWRWVDEPPLPFSLSLPYLVLCRPLLLRLELLLL